MMFLALKRFAQFSGRSRPAEFWMFFLLQAIIYTVLIVAALVIGGAAAGLSADASNGMATANGIVGMIATFGIFAAIGALIYLVFLVPNIAVSVRRLHDTDKSGWWLMLYWGPVLVSLALTVVGGLTQSSGLTGVGSIISLISWIGSLVLLVFMILPGTPGPNQYGPSPLGFDQGAMAYQQGYPQGGYPPQQGYAPQQGYPHQGYPPQQ